MIKPEQMSTAAQVVRKLDGICTELTALSDRLRAAGLQREADALTLARGNVSDVSATLDREATETFVALRQGKPTPA